MNNPMFENMNKFGKNSYDTIKELYAMNTNLVEQLVEQQFALFALGVEYTTRQMKLASTAKGYKEVLSGQTDIASELSSKLQGIARNTLDIFNESKDEIGAWLEKSAKEAEKGIKEVSKITPASKAA